MQGFHYAVSCEVWNRTQWIPNEGVTFLKIWSKVIVVLHNNSATCSAFSLYFYIYFFAVDFLDGFEAKSPQHLALRPMYVRSYTPVPSQHAKQHYPSPSKLTQSPSGKIKTTPLQLRGTDRIRLYNSDSFVNMWDCSRTERHLAMSHNQPLAMQPRPKSLCTPTHNSEYVWTQISYSFEVSSAFHSTRYYISFYMDILFSLSFVWTFIP